MTTLDDFKKKCDDAIDSFRIVLKDMDIRGPIATKIIEAKIEGVALARDYAEEMFKPFLYVDDDGYICFENHNFEKGPGLWWTLHYDGWDAYVDNHKENDPVYGTGDHMFPSDNDQVEAASFYEAWCIKHAEEI